MILHGDCLEVLKDIPDNSIDSIVTDPPYGLSFMGKKWDYSVPSVEIWKEALRVLKPGGHLLSFGGTRTYHRMVVNIEDAGFEIRDQIQWIYGSGFPKSHNLPGGIGTALKPANEPIVMARKPLVGTVAKNVAEFGTGGLNIDSSRIGTEQIESGRAGRTEAVSASYGKKLMGTEAKTFNNGRWPANVIFDEEAAAMLDEQAPNAGANGGKSCGFDWTKSGKNMGKEISKDKGGASRFFYVAKASKKERGVENNHPTVKPIKLMEYLIKLVTPADGIVLDPFAGSGSTLVAAKGLGFDSIGIEREAEYVEIIEKRLEATNVKAS